MELASEEVMTKCAEVRAFSVAFTLYLAIQEMVGDMDLTALLEIADRNARVSEKFSGMFQKMNRGQRPEQSEAYDFLFSYRDEMGPVVRDFQTELDNVGSRENVVQQFQELLTF